MRMSPDPATLVVADSQESLAKLISPLPATEASTSFTTPAAMMLPDPATLA